VQLLWAFSVSARWGQGLDLRETAAARHGTGRGSPVDCRRRRARGQQQAWFKSCPRYQQEAWKHYVSGLSLYGDPELVGVRNTTECDMNFTPDAQGVPKSETIPRDVEPLSGLVYTGSLSTYWTRRPSKVPDPGTHEIHHLGGSPTRQSPALWRG
jgi:hypothetical protein